MFEQLDRANSTLEFIYMSWIQYLLWLKLYGLKISLERFTW